MRAAWGTLLSVWVLTLFVLTLLAAPAWAGPSRAVDHAFLQRVSGVETERRSTFTSAQTPEDTLPPRSWLDLSQPVLLAPSAFPRSTEPVWRLGELPLDTLELRIDCHPTLCFLLSADLDVELPRLDAVDGETYFIAGVEFRIRPDVALFVEDFQPASGVVRGDEDQESAVARSWDGHQAAVGARWRATDRVRREGALVGYVLSRTYRDEALGAYLTVTVAF
jgi:hypothetical protein